MNITRTTGAVSAKKNSAPKAETKTNSNEAETNTLETVRDAFVMTTGGAATMGGLSLFGFLGTEALVQTLGPQARLAVTAGAAAWGGLMGFALARRTTNARPAEGENAEKLTRNFVAGVSLTAASAVLAGAVGGPTGIKASALTGAILPNAVIAYARRAS